MDGLIGINCYKAAVGLCVLCVTFGGYAPRAVAETPGKDGAMVVSSTNTVLNEYGVLAGAASSGSSSITVTNLAGNLPSLTPGDLILIYQANGATISGANNASYGAITNIGNAGRYEFQTVESISGNTITLESYLGTCSGLEYSYGGGDVQVIRVPQYTTLTIISGANVRAPAWNGTTGGVAALHVRDTLTLSGDINVSARGFRGGEVDNASNTPGTITTIYASSNASDGAEKGEGIAGFQNDYPVGRYGRGAPANGGGGGNSHNAGGGGGANGDDGNPWNGQGNPDRSNASWDAAWNIDGTLTATTLNSGGGRGGYTYGRDGDALTLPPGATAWGNDFRREVGGLGGRPIPFDATGRLFFGGGGGAGDGNNAASGAGGRGGGLAIVIAGSVAGGGRILSSGQAGRDTSPSHNDAPGGGGAGGTVLIKTSSLSAINILARGGRGGRQLITNTENEGPGGGGGGGVIAVENGFPTNRTNGGVNGTTSATSMDEFIPNGATKGAGGQSNESAPSDAALPFCRLPYPNLDAVKTVTMFDAASGAYSLPGEDASYTISVTNSGAGTVDASTIDLVDKLPDDVTFYNGEYDPSGAPISGPIEFVDSGSGLSCCTGAGEVEYSNTLSGPPVFGYTPAAGYDPAVRYVRVKPGGIMAGLSSFSIRFRTRIN